MEEVLFKRNCVTLIRKNQMLILEGPASIHDSDKPIFYWPTMSDNQNNLKKLLELAEMKANEFDVRK